MTKAEEHIKYYNSLKGKRVSVKALKRFYEAVKKTLSSPGVNGYTSDLQVIAYRIAGGVMAAGKETSVVIKNITPIVHKAAPRKVVVREKIVVQKVIKTIPATKAKESIKNRVGKASTLSGEHKRPASDKPEPVAINQVEPKPSKPLKPATPVPSVNGFTTVDKAPQQSVPVFILPGEIGTLLGELQAYKLVIIIAGETHSSKSELAKQIADAFISAGFTIGWIDWEQGGMTSKDTRASVERNISPQNRRHFHMTADLDRNIEAMEGLANHFEVVFADSGTKLEDSSNQWIERLRKNEPDTIWVPIMQLTKDGSTRGSSSAEYDAPIVIKTFRGDPSDYRKNYAKVEKNRGNPDSIGNYYSITDKKILGKDFGKKLEAEGATSKRKAA